MSEAADLLVVRQGKVIRVTEWASGVVSLGIGLSVLLWPGFSNLNRTALVALSLVLATYSLRAATVCVRIPIQQVMVRNRLRTYRLTLVR
jgi:hypothetical protein